MTEFEFLLLDRITKIKSINDLYNLEDNAYISFSGGKDSLVMSYLIDLSIPNNSIPRVFVDTGIEFNLLRKFVKKLAEEDSRIKIIYPKKNISVMLKEKGYPFKSKEHSQIVCTYQKLGDKSIYAQSYLNGKRLIQCPQKLRYQFSPNFNLKISDKCCFELKKEPCESFSKENKKTISIVGIRKAEGGRRRNVKGCTVFNDKNCTELKKFFPLLPCDNNFIESFIKEFKISLCDLYYPPYNLRRTGCKGCPYSPDIQKQLDMMSLYLPNERKQCELIWQPVYSEYRRIGYRLHDENLLF